MCFLVLKWVWDLVFPLSSLGETTENLCSGKVMQGVLQEEKQKDRKRGKQGGKKADPVCLGDVRLGSDGEQLQDSLSQMLFLRSCSCIPRVLHLTCSVVGFSTLLINNSAGKTEQSLTELLKV